jgi:hypothetical protein
MAAIEIGWECKVQNNAYTLHAHAKGMLGKEISCSFASALSRWSGGGLVRHSNCFPDLWK